MKKSSRAKKFIGLIIMIVTVMACTTTFAAIWWGDPGYQWALSNRLTPVKSTSQLNKKVSLTDFYTTVIKYLRLKGISPKNKNIHHQDNMDGIDNVAKGLFEIINDYNSKKSITIQQYYIVENYVKHGKKTLEDYMGYSQYLTRDSLKNIQLYLDLSQYKAATLIGSRSDREYILSRIGYMKNAEILNYHILPYAGDITREEFLVVMYDLISDKKMSSDAIIDAFYETEVLKGYETGLELDKELTYAEMLTFLYRFEIFDFGNGTEEEAE